MGTPGLDYKQDLEFFDLDIEEQQNQIADHLRGMTARRDGWSFDRTKSAAWQLGWAGIQLGAKRDSLC
jgi:hypothetical protein